MTATRHILFPLHHAACAGYLDVVKFLVEEKEFNIEQATDPDECTALHLASRAGHLEIIRYLVKDRNANSDICCNNGKFTPHDLAIFEGHLDIVKFFIEETGKDINQPNKNGLTPLYVAVAKNHLPIVHYLIAKKVDFHAYSPEIKATILNWATEYAEAEPEILTYLKNYKSIQKNGSSHNKHSSERERIVCTTAKLTHQISEVEESTPYGTSGTIRKYKYGGNTTKNFPNAIAPRMNE